MYIIKKQQIVTMIVVLIVAMMLSTHAMAKDWLVDSPKAYDEALSQVEPGDSVILKNGIWNDFEILFKGYGETDNPITLRAQTKGEVILSGQSNLRLSGKHLVVSGLVFKHGFTPSSAVIEFRENQNSLAYHSRVTEVVIDNYNNPDKREGDYWISIYGKHNRFDHSHLVGKRNKGVTVAVRLNSKESQENYHRIDHNYFGPRPILGSNGGETLRIGTSHHSLSNSFTNVEHNYFDRTNGEVEIISVKSGKNRIENNMFFESRGTLTLRHGNSNIIENNVFMGQGVDHTGGIRVINKDQVIRNNYMEGLTGYRFGSGFTVMNGVPNSPINRYHQVENALIENNSMINVEHIQFAAGSDQERSAVPLSSKFQHNLIFNENNKQPFTLFDDISGVVFSDNIANTRAHPELKQGIKQYSLLLTRHDNGLLYPKNVKRGFKGVSGDLTPTLKSETGVDWYPKTEPQVEFDSGRSHMVKPGSDNLFNAILKAKSGDILVLSNGKYNVRKIINIDKTITIQAKNQHKVDITFERSTLFNITDGGSLMLDGLIIDGRNSPDASGNALVRSQKWGMIDNYRFIMKNSQIQGLNINHSFHFFESGFGAFADNIELSNNKFINITGDVLRLDKEQENLGIYNAEYVTLTNNTFENIKGAVVKLYRGGTDESTFGPHLVMSENVLKNIGKGKRNSQQAAVYLHGVQVTNIYENSMEASQPIIIEHTVGEPKSHIENNTFEKTAFPSIVELHTKAPHTAILINNKQG